MSSRNNDLQFELNETLYFDRGDEVYELLGISLNPEITIHSYDTYVSIRGEIELSGEYRKDGTTVENNDLHSFDEFEAKRFVERVESKEEDLAEFFHRFPVDISVPTYRIDHLDDIRIDIINFDYEMPVNSKLHLTAIAEIQGIKSEFDLQQEELNQSKEDENDESSSFSLEVRREETDFEEVEEESHSESKLEEKDISVMQTEIEETNDMEERLQELDVKEANDTEGRLQELDVKETNDTEGRLQELNVEETEEKIERTEKLNAEEVEVTEEIEEVEEEDETTESKSELTIRAIEARANENDEEEAQEEVKDVSYLTDIFRDEAEENYTKMKICIVQEDDTIETIAERFQISTLQLIKQNKLDENFDISEGQLLYIPKK